MATRGYFPQRGVGSRRRGVRVELKKYDSGDSSPVAGDGLPVTRGFEINATTTVDNTNVWCICAPVIGSEFFNRIGRRIQVRMIQVSGYWRPRVDTFVGTGKMRLVCVVDMQHNGTTNPAITDILSFSGTTYCSEFMNLDNRSRFKVIFDRRYVIYNNNIWNSTTAPDTASAASTTDSIMIDVVKKVNFPVTFGASSTTPKTSDIQTGAILLFAYSDDGGSGGGYRFRGTTRVRYTDA